MEGYKFQLCTFYINKSIPICIINAVAIKFTVNFVTVVQ